MKRNVTLGVLTALMLVGMFSMVSAYDANTPFTTSVRWIIPSDTSFTATFCGSETSIDFDTNISTINDAQVNPDCQVPQTNTPIITLANTGNVALNFSGYLTASKPAWAVYKVNNESSYAGADTVDTTSTLIQDNVATSGEVKVFVWTDLTAAVAGTTTRTYQVNSTANA